MGRCRIPPESRLASLANAWNEALWMLSCTPASVRFKLVDKGFGFGLHAFQELGAGNPRFFAFLVFENIAAKYLLVGREQNA